MRHIAIIGSGPAGYYTAEAAHKHWGDDGRVDIFDTLPVPYGLIRTGVAPDHQSIKGVSRRYENTALSENVRFVGNVTVGKDVTVPELQSLYDVVVFATGAPNDRPLGLPGEELANGKILNTLIPNSELHVLEGGGHLFLLSHADQSVSAIRAFLDAPEAEEMAQAA